MMPRGHAGLSLVELLVSVTLLGIVGGGLTSAVLSAVRTADRSRERARQQGVVREVAGILDREVGSLAVIDIGSLAAESVSYRAARGSGYTCGIEGTAAILRDSDFRAWRLPDADRDSVLLFIPDSAAGAQWIAAPILAPVGRGHCPDGSPGIRVPLESSLLVHASTGGVAIRVFEWWRIRLYQSNGSWWLGARSLRPGDVTQPVAGPLKAHGMALRWLGADGAPAVSPADVRMLALEVMADAAPAGPGRGTRPDTLRALIPLAGGDAP